MTFTDWILDLALILIVFRQLREQRINLHFVLLPLAIIGFVGHNYLHSFPTAGNDLVLIGALALLGLSFGTASALTSRVRFDGRHAFVRASWTAAGLWVLGMSLRLAFQLYVTHGGGAELARFSQQHQLTGSAWVTALVLMAFAEVFGRLGVVLARAARLRRQSEPVAPQLVAA